MTRQFGVMIQSKDEDYDGCWLSRGSMPATRDTSQAMRWAGRNETALYISVVFGRDPNMHNLLTVEEIPSITDI
jgi:hypothetical protein